MSLLIRRLLTSSVLLVIGLAACLVPALYSSLLLAFILFAILVTEWPRLACQSVWLWFLTPLYPVAPFLALIALNQSQLYRPLLVLVFISAAAHDSGSYIVGNLIGRHRIAPTISPGKTWEGFLGGIIITAMVLWIIFKIFALSLPMYQLILLTIILCTVAFLGDLFESWLKRKAHIKDSGSLLPGHGGLLDRFDSVMFVGAFVYMLRQVFVNKLL